jgi:hypothetical protein
MWKKYAPALTGMSLLLGLPVLAADKAAPAKNVGGCVIARPAPVQNYFKKTIFVEIKGKLQQVEIDLLMQFAEKGDRPPRFPMPRLPVTRKVWQVTVNGQPYDLNFQGDTELEKLAQKLKGKTVKLVGRLEEPRDIIRPLRGPGSKILEIGRFWQENPVVFLTRLEAVEGEYVRETVQVVLRGKLNLDTRFGCPPVKAAAIQVNGQSYLVDFGSNQALHQLAKKLDGKTVILTGTYGGKRSFPSMCLPKGFEIQVINVTSLQGGDSEGLFAANQVVIKGKLFDSSILPVPYQDFPKFTVSVKGVSYALDFDGNQALLARAKKLGRKTVILQGILGTKVLGDTLWKVVTVTDLKADEGEYIHRTETVEIRGQIVFPPLPDCVGYQGLFCMITVNGEGHWLDFQDHKNLAALARNLKGKTVIITGTLGKRSGCGPVRVLVDGMKTLPEPLKVQPA